VAGVLTEKEIGFRPALQVSPGIPPPKSSGEFAEEDQSDIHPID